MNNIEINNIQYKDLLDKTQSYLKEVCFNILNDYEKNKEQILNFMDKYVLEELSSNIINVEFSYEKKKELLERLFNDMYRYSFLTKYIYSNEVEEININSWDSIEIIFRNGEIKKISERFLSLIHAEDIVKRMLNKSGKVLDNSTPCQLSEIESSVRIACLKTPIVATEEDMIKIKGD